MGSFDHQEKSESTQRLHALLSGVKAPARQKNDWQRLENNIFAALDDEKQATVPTASAAVSSPRFFFALPRFSVAWAAAAALVLSATAIGLSIAYHKTASDATAAAVVSVRGRLAVQWEGKGPWDTLSSGGSVAKTAGAGTIFSTLPGSSAVILLDKGSIVRLYERSVFTLRSFARQQRVCFLARGGVLVKVNKLQPGQKFEVRTPCAMCSVVGTIFRVDAAGSTAATTLSVYQGKVRMAPAAMAAGSASVATVVATGRQMTISQSGAVTFGRITEKITPIRDISALSMLVEPSENIPANAAVVDITSTPEGAKVMINNVLAGITPLLVREIPGRYNVAMFAGGCVPYESAIDVGRDRIVSLAVELQATPTLVPPKHRAATAVSMPARRAHSEQELRLMPCYVEALVNISSGEYQQALAILDSLSGSGMVDIRQRMSIMEAINSCYAKLGDFGSASNSLEEKLQKTDSPREKDQILWEIANVKANCLGDYEGAEMALVEFLIVQPDAMWAHDAYSKLAETQYYLGKYKSAAETYLKHIRTFPEDPDIDHSMFNLACILGGDMGDCIKAADWYARLLNSFHASKYRSAALFRRAECYMQMGRTDDAIRDYRAYLALEPDGIWRTACVSALKKCKIL
jgi:TolA-binding protein